MYKTYLISYDVLGGANSIAYKSLREAITKAPFWAKPLESLYLIKSNQTAIEIARILQTSVGALDRIFVVEVSKDWGSLNLPQEIVEWIRNNI